MSINIQHFYDELTATLTYVVWHPETKDAIVIDPVLDFDQASGKLSLESVQELTKYIQKNELNLHFILETHAHADHLSGAQELKKHFPKAQIGIGEKIIVVQKTFKSVFNLSETFPTNGSQFDFLLKDSETLKAGKIEIKVINTPGHTPACTSFLIEDAVFTGDALFMPDTGTGRCDFPNGSSEALYLSITKKLYSLPENTRVFTGHDYKNGNTRIVRFESKIAEQKEKNVHIKASTSKEEYCKIRDTRDANLPAPKLLLPSIQVNISAGVLPEAESNGMSYLKLPLKKPL